LKPDACRRVVGRLPSPHIPNSLQKPFGFQQRGMAPPFSLRCFSLRKRREVHGGLSCEIVSDLCPNPLSHDWHVQPSCQRPNRDPPERREFSPGEFVFCGRTHRHESDCPRNPTNIPCGEKPVNVGIPQNFHAFSTTGKTGIFVALALVGISSTQRYAPSAWDNATFQRAHRSGRQKIEKRTYFWRSLL
jgi:hypothetical protein